VKKVDLVSYFSQLASSRSFVLVVARWDLGSPILSECILVVEDIVEQLAHGGIRKYSGQRSMRRMVYGDQDRGM